MKIRTKKSHRIALLCIGLLLTAAGAQARVTRIVVDSRKSPDFAGASFGAAGPYETLVGRAFGELDPKDPHNSIIQDIQLAPRNARGMVEYTASFQIVKPVDMSKASHLMWHDVPNRGGRITIVSDERTLGDVGLSSGWQGDNTGATSVSPTHEYVQVPVAHNPDGSTITGQVMARIFNASGPNSSPMYVANNPVPYKPASLDTSKATLTTHASETIDGKIGATGTIAAGDWAWAKCDAAHPFPGTPDPTQICLKSGFDPALLYQVVFTAQDPPVLGIGFAAFRDVGSFFRYAAKDDAGTPNPLAGDIKWTISRGVSQSGNFLRQFLHLGFNQDEAKRQVYDGAWPIIAGRRISMDVRFAEPDGVLTLDQLGSEGPQWWSDAPDPVRGLPSLGILDRCNQTHTCPKIIEHFGSAEVWGLKLTPEWIGTAGDRDIPLPDNVRRYYISSTQHGGGRGGFSTTPAAPPMCPSFGWGKGVFATNPMPQTQTVNAIRVHFRDWVMKNVMPPPSVYPTLAAGLLVDDTKEAMGFPTIPGVPATAPTGMVNPVLDYDFGPGFNPADGSGVESVVPPTIKHVINMKVPKVDADGNELGGVPVVLREAPLGTYLGWNITAAGFFKGMECNYGGGMIPFANTKAERTANGDPRLSLEAFLTIFGITQAEAQGRRVSELGQHQWDVPALRNLMEKVLPENKPIENFEIEDNFPVLGRRVFNLNARKISQPGNHAHRILLVFEDITDRKQRERDAQMLTNEISHRIKNNLQIVVGLIAYEIRCSPVASVPGLKAMQARIGAIADLYDLLSHSSRRGAVALDAYLQEIAKRMSAGLLGDLSGIEISVKAAPLEIDPDRAVPFGLLVNELATNAIKHAFPTGKGHLTLSVEQIDDEIELIVADDGIGIKDKTAAKLPEKRGSDYVAIFVRQLGGTITKTSTEGNGTVIKIRLPLLLIPSGGAEPLAA